MLRSSFSPTGSNTARSSPMLPPSTRSRLSSERLPHTAQTSPALSLMTSQSAHSTALIRLIVDGYPLDSGSPYRLWFAFSFPGGRVDDPVIGDGIDSHCLLREAKEELASTF